MTAFSIENSQSALRACTAAEVASGWDYKYQIAVEQFVTGNQSDAKTNAYSAKLDALFKTCDPSLFTPGQPKSTAPKCQASEINWLNAIKASYQSESDLSQKNSQDISNSRLAISRYIGVGQSQMAQSEQLKLDRLIRDLQTRGILLAYLKQEFNSLNTGCRSSGVALPPDPQPTSPSNSSSSSGSSGSTDSSGPIVVGSDVKKLIDFPERLVSYYPGDISPDEIDGNKCGPGAISSLSLNTLVNGSWSKNLPSDLSGYEFSGKYAVEVVTLPLKMVRETLSNKDYRGVVWPYEINQVFALDRCDVGKDILRAQKSYDVASLAGKSPNWNRQVVDNLKTTTFNGNNYYYRVSEAPSIQNLTDPAWACVLKKPIVTTVKKNGKSVKVSTPATSDFKVNVTSDGTTLSVWECDDLVQGKFVKVQDLSLSKAWDASTKTPDGVSIWAAGQTDPRLRNWYWACPTGTGSRTCYPVSSLK